ncbi:MAG TPA: alpha/beta hydrolase [Anaerolineae bacterium]|nr:alpha/beta hydrolase [Anaerolineae bacterium]
MLKELTFDTGEVTLNYAEGPATGAPLVLLHGFTGRWQGFLPLLPVLSLRWHVYAPDYRGHGKSGRVGGKYLPDDFVSDLAAFLERQVIEPAVVFGHSYGALFALRLAERLPETVRALIIGDTSLSAESAARRPTNQESWAMLRELAGWEGPIEGLTEKLAVFPVPGQDPPVTYGELPDVHSVELREWARSLIQLDPDVTELHAYGGRGQFIDAFDFERMLAAISCPVLLLQGDPSEGGIMTDADVDYAMALLREAYHVQIEKTGHGLGMDTWEVGPILRAVVSFLESL